MSAFGIGVPELVIIMVLALLVFGPGKLPEIGAQIGRAIRDFQKTSAEITSEFTREIALAEQAKPDFKDDQTTEIKGESQADGEGTKIS